MACSRTIAALLALLALAVVELPAQTSVMLRLRPRLGDTLHMRLEQEMEMRGRPQASADGERTMSSLLRVRARAIPTRLDGNATILTTITDSIVAGPGSALLSPDERVRRTLLGRPVEVRVRPDGAMEVLDRDRHEDDVSPLFGQMPAVLPGVEVRTGEQWVREMRLPVRGTRGPALVRATFRLDSLGRGDQVAYISVRGTFFDSPVAAAAGRPMEGVLTGSIEFDRHLGWIRELRTTVVTRTDVQPADSRVPPMAVWMRITQRLQAGTTP
jgi:hypothetical protein